VTQTTPTLALVKPGGGSTGLNTPADRVDIDVINSNMDKIDTFATAVGPPATQNKQFYGAAASVGAVTGMKVGDRYQESDAGFRTLVYDGVQWIPTLTTNVNAGGDFGPGEVVAVSVNLPVLMGRLYRISAQVAGSLQGTGSGLVQVRLKLGAPVVEFAMVLSQTAPAGTTMTGHASVIWQANTGSGVANFQVTVATTGGFAYRIPTGLAQVFAEPCY
jgi:hypothetical protein